MSRIRYSRILCPIDFSPRSRAAFERACAIAREHHAELRLLHVMEPGTTPFARRLDASSHETMMERLRAFPKGDECDGIRLGAAIREGEPAREILRTATRFRADLIVMGAGRTIAREARPGGLGHVARMVSDRALCPVLMIPSPARHLSSAPFGEIVCATDTDPGSLAVVAHALSLAQEAQGHLTLVHVEPEPTGEDLYPALASAIPQEALNWCDARIVVTSGNPAMTIVEMAETIAADLIVVGPPRAVSSVTHAVAANATCPVLIAHDPPGHAWRVAPRVMGEVAFA
jgi:nucleotide-binding universal stress UspA family protein